MAKFKRRELDKILTKEFLIQKIIDENTLIYKLAEEIGCNPQSIYQKLIKHKIQFKKSQFEDLSNKEIGDWTVLHLYKSDKNGTQWTCKCKCGNIKIIHRHSLIQGKSKSCVFCAGLKKRNKEEYRLAFYNATKINAKDRNIEFNISYEYLKDLFYKKQNRKCALSGEELKFANTNKGHFNKETTASLDRIDSTKGYIEGNVQWIHKDINKMKSAFSQIQFLNWCEKINNHVKSTTISYK